MNKKGDLGWLLWVGIIIVVILLVIIIVPLLDRENYQNNETNLSLTAPETASEQENFNITVSSEYIVQNKNITNLVIGFGEDSVSDPNSVNDYEFMTTTFCASPCPLSQNFIIQMNISEPGIYYIRAFGDYDGKTRFSEEEIIAITPQNSNSSNTSF